MKRFSVRPRARRMLAAALAAAFFLVSGLYATWAQSSGSTAGKSVSGIKWPGGNEGSFLMHPGLSCIDCHAKGEGPRYLVAGTVYTNFDEPDDWYGFEGAVVQITDARGQVLKLTTNRAGNFYLGARGNSITFPIKAEVQYKGKVRAMATPQSTGNCMMCHTAKGLGGAPGRIIVPSG
jgi:hypothetical protein